MVKAEKLKRGLRIHGAGHWTLMLHVDGQRVLIQASVRVILLLMSNLENALPYIDSVGLTALTQWTTKKRVNATFFT